jgi:hypothetical protein
MKRLITIITLLGWAATGTQAQAPTPDEEIQYLLQFIKGSLIVFVRNGEQRTPAEAADHIGKKRDNLRDQISTAEDFIRLAATKSEASGQPYLVILADGKTEEMAKWLTQELERHRAEEK